MRDDGLPGEERTPLTFWLLVAAAAFYLAVRAVQMVAWLFR